MRLGRNLECLLLMLCAGAVWGQQSTDYIITEFPIGVRNADDTLTVRWTGNVRVPPLAGVPAPDSGFIYFDRNPGGSDPARYRYSVTAVLAPELNRFGEVELVRFDNKYLGGFPPERATRFVPREQPDMHYGVYYCVVALPLEHDTLVSNEFQIFIQYPEPVTMTGPVGTTQNLTPTFTWQANPGVPYYHIILSDKEINFEDSGGVSIVWQAITPHAEITYGVPDPSGTITAHPPPLSPGERYTWIVLNNYANHMAFSSYIINKPLGFSVGGPSLKKPRNEFPSPLATFPARLDTLNSTDNPTLTFEWSNLDTAANTYQVYVYVAADFEGIDAQLVVWEGEVMAGPFRGESIASVTIDAASILTSNLYSWRVFAVDDRGGGTAGEMTQFRYASPQGVLEVATRERITAGTDTLIARVGLVEIEVEVLDGSMEAPLAFYTDVNGDLSRERPVGAYRITARKEGFEPQSRTVTLREHERLSITLYLERPEAVVYGRVLDKTGQGVNLARVRGVSERGDSVVAQTNAQGNFLLNTYAADWDLSVSKPGFISVLPRKVRVAAGESHDAGTFEIEFNPLSLSGVVTNASGQPVLGARVRLFREGVLVQELHATPQSGAYAFNVTAGTYRLEVSKTGFSTFTSPVELAHSRQISVTIEARAFLVKGAVYGLSWVDAQRRIAPIAGATVAFVPLEGRDTLWVSSHRQYGTFTLSLPGDGRRYRLEPQAQGYGSRGSPVEITTRPDTTWSYSDTLTAFAMIAGEVLDSETGSGQGGGNVTLIDTLSGDPVRSVRSALDGTFELNLIPDGIYWIQAGKEGLQVDSVGGGYVLRVDEGRADKERITVYTSAGSRSIVWSIDGGRDKSSLIKVRSPLIRTLGAGDTLKNVGNARYTIVVDAADPAVIDLSRHVFTVGPDDPDPFVVALDLPLRHDAPTSVTPVRDSITLVLRSLTPVDSASLLYRDITAQTFREMKIAKARDEYLFTISPPRDGSTMQYWFRAWSGSDVYGYEQQLFTTYVEPDWRTLSRYEVLPSAGDTLTFPSSASITFSFKGFYSSAFLPADSVLYNDMIHSWKLINPQGCSFERGDSTGLSVTVRTPRSATSSLVRLAVRVNTNRIGLKAGVSPYDTVLFRASGAALDTIIVDRLDGTGVLPNAGGARAQVRARGYDRNRNPVHFSPQWRVEPAQGGTVDDLGYFRPAAGFVGRGRIVATSGNVRGEYVSASGRAGIAVGMVLVNRSAPDTADNGRGLTLIFPDSVVSRGDVGLVTVEEAALTNLVSRGYGTTFIAGSAWDILENNNVRLSTRKDSIVLRLSTGDEAMAARVASEPEGFFVARWDTAQYLWKPMAGSVVDSEGRWIDVRLASFSRYAVGDSIGKLSARLGISPNPFSPYVTPASAPRPGTAIWFSLDAREGILHHAWVRIYNIMNDLVYSVKIAPIAKGAYVLWWDGTTTDRTRHMSDVELRAQDYTSIGSGRMCRNGRYTVVLTVRDLNGKEKQYMKPVVLFK